MKQLANPPSANERALAAEYRERLTGLVVATITLTKTPLRTVDDVGLELLFKNGTLLDPSVAYSISGKTITLTVAAIAGDVFVVRYPYAINS